MNTNEKVAWGWIAFFSLFTILQYVVNGLKLFDYGIYIVIIAILLLVNRHMQVPTGTIWLLGLSTLMHALGTISFMYHGQQVSLYHDVFFNGNYDLFTHFYGLCLGTMGILHYYLSHQKRPSGFSLMLVGLAMVGAGAFIEMAEFAGYRFFGFGWGAFAFGAGDNSFNFGPWGDSMTDLYANLAGIIVGFLLYLLWKRRAGQTPIKQR